MKYNLTNETFLPSNQRNFPGVTDLQFHHMLGTTLFYFWIPIIVSFISYIFIYNTAQKLFVKPNTLTIAGTGLLLSLTTPIVFFLFNVHNNFYEVKAETISWTIYFIISIWVYLKLNNNNKSLFESNGN